MFKNRQGNRNNFYTYKQAMVGQERLGGVHVGKQNNLQERIDEHEASTIIDQISIFKEY